MSGRAAREAKKPREWNLGGITFTATRWDVMDWLWTKRFSRSVHRAYAKQGRRG